jgi:hypothetical protein
MLLYVEVRVHGRARIAEYGWWGGAAGLGAVATGLNYAWERKVPVCTLLGPVYLVLKGVQWVAVYLGASRALLHLLRVVAVVVIFGAIGLGMYLALAPAASAPAAADNSAG